MTQVCDRCGKESVGLIGSYFNTDMICSGCEAKEHAHPQFEEARRVENEHVKIGDYNFAGIGLPADL